MQSDVLRQSHLELAIFLMRAAVAVLMRALSCLELEAGTGARKNMQHDRGELM
jgi:hypothetical protein